MEITLSRLQHSIQDWNEQLGVLSRQLGSARFAFGFKIFGPTTQEDYSSFLARLNERKKAEFAIQAQIDSILRYVGYLKNILNEENQKTGIAQKLVRSTILSRRIEYLQNFIDLVRSNHASGMEEIGDVEVYKTTFTEQQKYYDLELFIFSEDDLAHLTKQRHMLIEERQRLSDEIATMNQKHTVQASTFEDFCSQQADRTDAD